MKNALFAGIIGENPAVLLSREQTPGIGMPLLNKDGDEKYRCCTCAAFAATGLLLEVTSQSEKSIRETTQSVKSPLLESSLH